MKSKRKMTNQFRMTNTVVPLAFLFTLFLFGSCTDSAKLAKYEQKNQTLTAENDSLENVLSEKEDAINNFMEMFNEIENNLTVIKEKEKIIEMRKNDPELEAKAKDGIIRDIQLINTMMEENRKMMAFMKAESNKAGLKISSFEKQVARLNTKLDEKDNAIERLKDDLAGKDFEIAALNTVVDTLSNQISGQAQFIASQDEAIHTSYFTKGTYKELKENGIIETSGLFPWADRNKELNEELRRDQFAKVDIREFTNVPINSTKANLITKHPEGTYEFTESEQGQIASLEITKPDEFWKLSDYLVVEVK